MSNLKKIISLSASILAIAGIAYAEAPPEVIVTITRDTLPVAKIGQAVDVLSDRDIKDYQSLLVADLLTHTTDLSLARNGGPGQTTTASLRGAGSDQTLFILDGIRLNDPSQVGGGTDLGLLATDDIARIEILRGPLSTLWGSGAMGGLISMTTRTPNRPLGGDLRIEGFDQYGSARLGIGGRADRLNWRLFTDVIADRGVSAFAGGAEKDGFDQTQTGGRVSYDVTDAVTLKALASTTHSRSGFDGYNSVFPYNFMDTGDFDKTDTGLGSVAVTHRFGAGEQTLSLSGSQAKRNNFNPDGSPNFVARGQIQSADYHISYHTGATRLLGGLSYERDSMRVAYPSSYDPNPVPLRVSSTLSSVYGQVSHDVGAVTVALSARHDNASSLGGLDIAQLSLTGPIGGNLRWRVSGGQGVKVPSLYQLYSDYGSAGLKAEKGTSLDGGLDITTPGGLVRVGVFSRRVHDQIDFAYSGCLPSQLYGCYGNVARTETTGIELTIRQPITPELSLSGNYTLLHARNESAGSQGQRLPRRPDQMSSADLTWTPVEKLRLGLGVRHVGASMDTAYTPDLKAYDLVDLRAEYTVSDAYSLFGRVENAGDTRYQTAGGYGQPGRRVWIGLQAKLF